MASSPAYFFKMFTPFPTSKRQKYPPLVRFQTSHDEGKSYNIVDANMSKLGRRIEQLRMKERLNTAWYRSHEDQINGWNYKTEYDDTYKERALFVQSLQLAALIGSTIGLVFLVGSIFICLYSLLLHINIHTT